MKPICVIHLAKILKNKANRVAKKLFTHKFYEGILSALFCHNIRVIASAVTKIFRK